MKVSCIRAWRANSDLLVPIAYNDKETAESVLRSVFSPRDEQDHGACTFAT